MKLSKNFTLEEMIRSDTALRRGIANVPDDEAFENLRRTAAHLEDVRDILGGPILISSGYRCLRLNRQIGSKDTSAHIRGLAVDFTCPEFGTPLAVARKLAKHAAALQFDQLILEFANARGGGWVHVGFSSGAPRGQLLTIDQRGTMNGLTRHA